MVKKCQAALVVIRAVQAALEALDGKLCWASEDPRDKVEHLASDQYSHQNKQDRSCLDNHQGKQEHHHQHHTFALQEKKKKK